MSNVPQTLLLADDSVTIQRVIELTFADEDIKVVAVSDGDQAIQHLDAAPPDIVLADIGMPGKNGYEVAQYVRQTPKLSHIPVVLLTGAFEPVDQARATEAGCDGVLAKPFEPQLVIGRVKELLVKGHHSLSSADTVITASPFGAAETATRAAAAEPPLDDYFDRLDAAFSNLGVQPPAPVAAKAEPTLAPPPAPTHTADIDWFSPASASAAPSDGWDWPAAEAAATPAPDLPLSFGSTQPDLAGAETSAPAPTPAAVPVIDHNPAAPGGAESAQSDSHMIAAAAAQVAPIPAVHVEPPADEILHAAPAPEPRAAQTIHDPAPAIPAPPTPVPALPAAVVPMPVVAAPTVPAPQPLALVPRPVPEVPAAAMPSLGEAFAALLAAENNDPASPMPQWPAAAAAPTPAPAPTPGPAPEITDAMLDDVVRRVLERMSDAVVRDTASQLVSAIAERLVKEEIDRIKTALK
jgi:CheY-like chemotaxis protein